jgi:hypothetical protein
LILTNIPVSAFAQWARFRHRAAMDYAAAARHRHQAEEARAKADIMRDEETRAQYLRMADTYDRLAANEDQMASNPVLAPIPKAAE